MNKPAQPSLPTYQPARIPLNFFVLLFALSALLGMWTSYDPSQSSGTLIAILFGVALYFAIAYLARTEQAARLATSATLLLGLIFALYFITQYAHQEYPGKGGIIARLGELTTLLPDIGNFTPHLNAVATFLEVVVPLGIALTLVSQNRKPRIATAISTLLILYAIFLSASRGSWLALGVTSALAVALVVLKRLPRRTATLLIGAAIILAAAALLAVIFLGPDRLPFLSSTFSRASDRGQLFQNSLYVTRDYAFTGAGLGGIFAMVYSRYGLLIQVPFLTYAHNLPLSVWFNQGLPGVIALLGIILTFYIFVIQVMRKTRPSILFHGAWLGVSATLLHGLTDAPQYADSLWVMPMLFIGLGLTIAWGRLAPQVEPQPGIAPARSFARPIAAAALIALIAFIAIFNQPLRATWQTNLGAIDETRAELASDLTSQQRTELYASAHAHYQAALDIDPDYPNANRRLGNLLVNFDQYDQAVPLLESAFQSETTNPAAIKGLGLAYVWVGRSEDAARTFFTLDDPGAMSDELYVWGGYRVEQDRALLGAYAYETAQIMYPTPDNTNVILLVADTYVRAGQEDVARVWYNHVIDIEPDNQRAHDALAAIGAHP